MSKDIKADLSLLNKLVSELSSQLDLAYKARDTIGGASITDENYKTFVVELSKSVGILLGITNESSLLIGDIQKIMKFATQPSSSDDFSNVLKSYLSTKPGGGSDRN